LLLPLACNLANRNKAKLLFDAKEYYPREFENNFLWRFLIQPFNKYLCKTYLHQCDKVITVSDGLAREYKKEYGIESDVIMSLPKYHEIEPALPQNNFIRLIYHGQASPDRQIEKMIEVMDYLDERFSLDLMLVPTARLYWQRIVSMAKSRTRVRIIPPVPMKEIIENTCHYDIGIFICPPTTFNLQYALPNKLFEYIQARLVVAIGPSIEMQKIVQKYQCGIVASDFEPETLAKELNELEYDEVVSYKCQSNVAALELNSNLSGARVRTIVRNLLRD
jgi:glycosyltransferase involved in cell wall biosynthesis